MDREQVDRLWQDDSNWITGIIYRCAEDPRAIVPRRWRWGGWTLNFSHPRACQTGLAAIALAIGPGSITLLLSDDTRMALGAMLASIVLLVLWAQRESTRYR